MYSLRKIIPILLLLDSDEDQLENEWSFISESGKQVPISVDRFINRPLNALEEHLSETDFKQLINDLNARKSEGISGNYCTQQGLELYWLEEELNGNRTLVIVSFGEVNAGRYRLAVEAEISRIPGVEDQI